MLKAMPTPVQKYLEQLEQCLKQKSGVAAEDALSDAREHLEHDYRELLQCKPDCSDDNAYRHFASTYGEPRSVAQQYEDFSKPLLLKLPGYAPGWRICCTRCGRSAPAARAGITRIGARSHRKYVVGWCRDCRWLRWLRIEHDLDRTNLTKELGVRKSPAELRSKKHRPWTFLAALLLSIFLLVFAANVGSRIVSGLGFSDPPADGTFGEMPPGWKVDSHIVFSTEKAKAIGEKFGGDIIGVTNTVIRDGTRKLQINEIQCRTANDATVIQNALAKLHSNPRDCVLRDTTVFEFVCRTPESGRFAAEARYRLPIQPEKVRYRVQFDAAPLAAVEPMAWNRFFNLFLTWEASENKAAIESQIDDLSKQFEFSNKLTLKRTGLGSTETQWSFAPQAISTTEAITEEAIRYEFATMPTRAGVRYVHVLADVTCERLAVTKTDRIHDGSLLAANPFWPVDDLRIQKLAQQITAGASGEQAKVDAIMAWFANSQNIRFDGKTGSRYGTLAVLEQKFGHCWDYSDLFVSLCRASGIRSRQVVGWLYGSSGHAWAEVVIGNAWRQMDPTTGTFCGSDYIPLVISEDGTIPFVYVSAVKIEVLP